MSVTQGQRKQILRSITFLFLLFLCYHTTISAHQLYTGNRMTDASFLRSNSVHPPCRNLPGANSTLVVLKTGSTELEAKLPVHFTTTLQCIPHSLLFSDAAEVFHGHEILDALEFVSQTIKETNPDFELYRNVREHGRPASKRPNNTKVFQESFSGHQENPGWKLDKWKFLPMINRTYHEYPEMKWYVFMEADSYISWPSLLSHLSSLDPTRPHYSGVEIYIGDVAFAHGGSGFIVSRPALQMVVEHFTSHQQEYEAFTDAHWAGDCVLGKAFTDSGVKLQGAWPVLQGDYPGIVPYVAPDGRPMPPIDQRLWCEMAVSWHHMEPEMILDLWEFDQEVLERKLKEGRENQTLSLRHGEMFHQYILPRIQESREDWDNEGGQDLGVAEDFQTCRSWCEGSPECVQYALDSDGHCRHFHLPRLGRARSGVQSGWLVERIEQRVQGFPSC